MKVVCFGCSKEAENLVENMQEYGDLHIEYFLDNNADENKTEFCGYRRYPVSKELCMNKTILVTAIKYYAHIKVQLEAFGLKENIDFIHLDQYRLECRQDVNLPVLKIWFEDFWYNFNIYDNWFVSILEKYYKLEYDNKDPDYIFCSVFGKKALRYSGIRIVTVAENIAVDYNQYDYAFGLDSNFKYMDRYVQLPLKYIFPHYELAVSKHTRVDIDEFMNREFCCRVVSDGACGFREHFFERLNLVKYVASGGRYRNNLPFKKAVGDKQEFLRGYKFNLAFENSATIGYLTEKVGDAWAANCIPIYWGDPSIVQRFNKESFVNCHEYNSVDELIDYLLHLESDKEMMEKMLKTPILKCKDESEKEFIDALLFIVSQKRKNAYRRNSFYSVFCSERLFCADETDHANVLLSDEDCLNVYKTE